MRAILFTIIVFFIVAISIFLAYHQNKLTNLLSSDDDLLNSAQIDIIFKQCKIFPNETELSIAFIDDNAVKFIGIKRQNDTLKYVTNYDKIFEIGSITKTFTGTVLAKLAFENKVELNEPIKNYLPIKLKQSSLNGVEVTLAHLANHTSGLPTVPDNIETDYSIPGSPYKFFDVNKLYDFLSNRLQLLSEPGKKKLYSNLGGGLLGHILTLITQESYEDLIGESICKPLEMNNTFVKFKLKHFKNLIRGRNPNGDIVENWDLNILAGAGEIKSTASDMVKYVQSFIEDTSSFYNLALQPTFQVNDKEIMCLGWGIYKLGETILYPAFGATAGYSSGIIFDKKTKKAVIVLTNVSAFLSAKGDYIPFLCRSLF